MNQNWGGFVKTQNKRVRSKSYPVGSEEVKGGVEGGTLYTRLYYKEVHKAILHYTHTLYIHYT